MMVAEKSKSEKSAQPRSFDLVPAHGLKISRSHSQQLPARLERFQQLHDTRDSPWHKLKMIGFDLAAHYIERSRQLRLEIRIRNARAPQCRAKDREISFAVIRNAFDGGLHAIGLNHRLVQGIPVHQVFGDQQGAIDVENVSVSARQGTFYFRLLSR